MDGFTFFSQDARDKFSMAYKLMPAEEDTDDLQNVATEEAGENKGNACSSKSSIGPCSQRKRLAHLRQVCDKHKDNLDDWYDRAEPSTYQRILVDDKHQVLYCAVAKAASTTFYNMFYLAVTGKPLRAIHCQKCWKSEGLVWLSNYPQDEREKRLRTYYKVISVRHPLDRLVSCWNNKLKEPRKGRPWPGHGPKMVELFRSIPGNSSLEAEIAQGARFDEFLRYVNYVEAHNQNHNSHWISIFRSCHPCSIEYDYIAKSETLDDDSKGIIHKLNLTLDQFPQINARRNSDYCPNTFTRQLEEYRNPKITAEDFAATMKFYKMDMELFGYTWNDDNKESRCGDSGCC